MLPPRTTLFRRASALLPPHTALWGGASPTFWGGRSASSPPHTAGNEPDSLITSLWWRGEIALPPLHTPLKEGRSISPTLHLTLCRVGSEASPPPHTTFWGEKISSSFPQEARLRCSGQTARRACSDGRDGRRQEPCLVLLLHATPLATALHPSLSPPPFPQPSISPPPLLPSPPPLVRSIVPLRPPPSLLLSCPFLRPLLLLTCYLPLVSPAPQVCRRCQPLG